MTKHILVLNGPNLNLLGQREPEKYGSKTLADVASELAAIAPALDVTVWMAQSNSEGTLIDHIHTARDTCPVIELHVTDIYAREQFRHHSYIAMRADKGIVGEGTDGYSHALRDIAEMV